MAGFYLWCNMKRNKICPVCGNDDWYESRSCKECLRIKSKERYKRNKHKEGFKTKIKNYRDKNKEKNNAYSKQYRKDNPDYFKEYNKKYYQENKERIKQYVKEYQRENKENVLGYKEKWRRNHPDVTKVVDQRRRAREASVESTLTEKEWSQTLEYFNSLCVYCGKRWEEQDHFVPLSKGGGYTKENIVPACTKCNRSKSYKHPQKFLGRRKYSWVLEQIKMCNLSSN